VIVCQLVGPQVHENIGFSIKDVESHIDQCQVTLLWFQNWENSLNGIETNGRINSKGTTAIKMELKGKNKKELRSQ
jgi:hypothetical protein